MCLEIIIQRRKVSGSTFRTGFDIFNIELQTLASSEIIDLKSIGNIDPIWHVIQPIALTKGDGFEIMRTCPNAKFKMKTISADLAHLTDFTSPGSKYCSWVAAACRLKLM